jgi:hypothetical protein
MKSNKSASDKLCAASGEAADIVLSLMRDVSVPPEVRLSAAEAVINSGELAFRLSKLEKSMEETNERLNGLCLVNQ